MACANHRFAESRGRLQRAVAHLIAAGLMLLSSGALAQRSYFRIYDQDYGLDVGEIVALAQDNDGFLWIGSHRGLVRFDGRNFVPWGQDQVDEVVSQIIHGADDDLLIRTATGRVLRRVARGLEAVTGPDGQPLLAVDSLAFDAAGNLWVTAAGHLSRLDRQRHWSTVDRGISADEKTFHVFAAAADIVVLTDAAAWRLHGSEPAARLIGSKDLWFAAAAPDGTVWLTTHYGDGLWRIDGAGVHRLERSGGRGMDMRERDGTLWLSLDKVLLAYGADGSVRKLGIAEGLPSGGPLLVDRENSLWLGTFVGLIQFPEPDTWQWSESDGLPSAHTYAVADYQGTVFASTWAGLARLDPAGDRLFSFDAAASVFASLCVLDGRGVWAFDRDHLLQWRNGHFEAIAARDGSALIDSCALDSNGTAWIATTAGLLRLPGGGLPPQRVDLQPPGPVDEIWSDADGDLRVLDDAAICRLRAGAGATALREDCHSIESLVVPNSIASVAPNRTWIAANNGIFEFDGEHVRRMPGNHRLAGGIIQSLTLARDGDWWAAGAGALLRVHDCGACEAGWEVRETPGLWQGLPGNSAILARESANGDLWIAGNRGIWRVPKAVRAGPEHAPRVATVRAGIDAVEQPLDETLALSPGAHRLELEFAALSFRDRSLLRFRSRLAGQDAWSVPSQSSVLQFAAPEPGAYRIEMAASLDGRHWSDPPVARRRAVARGARAHAHRHGPARRTRHRTRQHRHARGRCRARGSRSRRAAAPDARNRQPVRPARQRSAFTGLVVAQRPRRACRTWCTDRRPRQTLVSRRRAAPFGAIANRRAGCATATGIAPARAAARARSIAQCRAPRRREPRRAVAACNAGWRTADERGRRRPRFRCGPILAGRRPGEYAPPRGRDRRAPGRRHDDRAGHAHHARLSVAAYRMIMRLHRASIVATVRA